MLSDHAITLLQLTVSSIFVLLLAWRLGFFHTSETLERPPEIPRLAQVFAAFGIYLGVQMIIVPALAVGWASTVLGADQMDQVLKDPYIEGWVNFAGVCLSLPLVLAYSLGSRRVVWEKHPMTGRDRLRDLAFGFATWFVAFPIVSLTAEAVKELADYLVNASPLDQVAVRHLKSTYGDSTLLSASTVAIVLFAPIIEEVLFRGFLQSWLRRSYTKGRAIVLSSILFTLAHFSPSQGMANSELLAGLFVLACFLGFIYERQKTLWPCIALHCTFNSVSVAMILGGFTE